MGKVRNLMVAFGLFILMAPPDSFAQQPNPIPRIGVIRQQAPTGPSYEAFLGGLRDLGYVEGRNVLIDYRRGHGERLVEQARDLVRSNVNIIFAPAAEEAQAARKATATIPIVVATLGDPVKTGLASSLARPGGNVTGLTALGSSLSGKRLELLKDIMPKLTRVAVLWNPSVPDKVAEWEDIQPKSRALKLELLPVEFRSPGDFDGAFEKIRRLRPEAMIVLGDALASTYMTRIVEFAGRTKLPAMFNWPAAVESGALISYGPNFRDLHRRAATYVDKILKGAKPGDLPIEQPTKFEMYINGKTVKTLGLKIPNSVLVQVDKVIE